VSTQLKTIAFFCWQCRKVFNDEDATHHFVTTLQHQNSTVQELPEINDYNFPTVYAQKFPTASYASIKNSLIRNRQLNRANLLLAPPPPQQQQRNAGTMMLKISHKAITKFAVAPDNAGASAIFKLFQARPALLEKRIKRPAYVASLADATEPSSSSSSSSSLEPQQNRPCHSRLRAKKNPPLQQQPLPPPA
jgi:hypothetical protein